MSDTVRFAELDGQHMELLPARTVLSMFSAGDGGIGLPGTPGIGGFGATVLGVPLGNATGNGIGLPGASANG
jgi:hypothetical protein